MSYVHLSSRLGPFRGFVRPVFFWMARHSKDRETEVTVGVRNRPPVPEACTTRTPRPVPRLRTTLPETPRSPRVPFPCRRSLPSVPLPSLRHQTRVSFSSNFPHSPSLPLPTPVLRGRRRGKDEVNEGGLWWGSGNVGQDPDPTTPVYY